MHSWNTRLMAWMMPCLLLAPAARAEVTAARDGDRVTLRNGRITLAVDARAGTVSAGAIRDGAVVPMLRDGRSSVAVRDQNRGLLDGLTPTVAVRDVQDGAGTGKAVELAYDVEGTRVSVVHTLYDDAEFFTSEVLFAAGEKAFTTPQVTVLAGTLDVGGGEVRVLSNNRQWDTSVSVLDGERRSIFVGTVYNRQARRGAILGAMTAEAESMVHLQRGGDGVAFRMTADYGGPGSGRLSVAPGQTARTGAYAVSLPASIFEGLEAYGLAVKQYNGIELYRPIPAGWCSWDAFGWIMREQQIHDTIDRIEQSRLVEYGFNTLQIDDGWQCGWRSSGDWRVNPNRFPGGMRPIADHANEAGLTLGLWIAPFYDEDHENSAGPSGDTKPGAPRWMLDARPVLLNFPELMSRGGNGQPSGNYDISKPAFQEHLRETYSVLTHEYGARYIKTDFIAYGYAIEEDRSLPHHDVYRNALQAMRDGMAEGTYFMTCIAHDWKSLGIADAQRIGNDVSSSWRGIEPTIRCAAGRYFTNGNFWWNDPDQLHVGGSVDQQGRQHGLTMDQARAWAAMIALYGGVTLTGDDVMHLDPERTKLLTQTIPSTGLTARPLDLFDVMSGRSPEQHSGLWALAVDKPFGRYHVVGVFNWTRGGEQTRALPLADLGLAADQRVVVYDYWTGQIVGRHAGSETLRVEVPATSVRLLVVRPAGDAPGFLASDRHLATGVVDVVDAQYDAATRTLAGRSETLVARAPFRYTFYVPDGLRATAATFGGREAKVEMTAPNVATVEFLAPAADLDWSVRFE